MVEGAAAPQALKTSSECSMAAATVHNSTGQPNTGSNYSALHTPDPTTQSPHTITNKSTCWLTPGGGFDCNTCAQGGCCSPRLLTPLPLPPPPQSTGLPLLMTVAAWRIQLGLRGLRRKGASRNSTGRPAKAGPCAYMTDGSSTWCACVWMCVCMQRRQR